MKQYIDKSAVVAEIERRRKLVSDPVLSGNDLMVGEKNALFNLLSFIDTLEVKEVDLEEEIRKWQQRHFEGIGYILDGSGGWIGKTSILNIASHFYELGLNAQKGGDE